ncbi:hypothetical protein F5Y19DRAFT_124351 [Xylariaceae sp. FL1651]|nr:hypothetical protein F5Y19DRAFT_124351 [Xylariaceae sp. FL1651]
MSGWKGVVKSGWHPEKDGSSLKDQVKGLVGRGDKSSSEQESHIATPISSLRDPSSFGPPPKHIAVYGPTAASGNPPAARAASPYVPVSPAQSPSYATAPVVSQLYSAVQPYQQAQQIEEEPPAGPRPYRVDTTGLSTSHLPPPPGRRDGAGGRAPQPPPTSSPAPTPATTKPKVPPSLPPRLPPRSGNSSPSPTLASGHAAGQGQLNQGAIDRLGAAGISVPGLGIGAAKTPPPVPGARHLPPTVVSPTQATGYGQVDELQSQFARMGTSPSQASPGTTTWAQNQAALKTAQGLAHHAGTGGSAAATDGIRQGSLGQVSSVLGKKKPPPPPAPKKPELSVPQEDNNAPPPVPLATRPRLN